MAKRWSFKRHLWTATATERAGLLTGHLFIIRFTSRVLLDFHLLEERLGGRSCCCCSSCSCSCSVDGTRLLPLEVLGDDLESAGLHVGIRQIAVHIRRPQQEEAAQTVRPKSIKSNQIQFKVNDSTDRWRQPRSSLGKADKLIIS